MKLPKKLQWLKEHFEGLITEKEEELWSQYETAEIDILDEGGYEQFEKGWELGRIEAIQEVLNFIDDLENPVYGDI